MEQQSATPALPTPVPASSSAPTSASASTSASTSKLLRFKKLIRRRIWLISALGIVLILGSVAAYYVYSFYSFANKIYVAPEASSSPIATGDDGSPVPAEVVAPPEWSGDERINILLLGGDSRGVKSKAKPRSDTMMLVSIDPVDKSTHMFSLLRDTYVEIPRHGSNRLNAAITMGGPLLSMETVGNLVGLPIHYYVYTDFEGFISLIDELGGIDFEVDKTMKRTDNQDDPRYNINLEKGMQHLDGITALQYVRYRSDALSDFARSERQRKFLTAIADKMQRTTSLLRLPSLLNGIAPYIETNIPPSDLIKLARLGMKLDTSRLAGIQVPQNGAFKEETIDKMEVLVPNVEQIKSYVQEQLQPPTTTTTP
ncbi:LytR family transcriptional regulator [Cohnella endophytica]|uniref:LytR family transcriptional regulator n=1 Tax=Cohnella endophytica TaxID=2419778 RepID=A0A494XGN6_9BACL|nr:LCP family protein [Cohnella endophytica]RKP49820.1 LytR family transcriptional regulator [Cohnella endophytica]